MASFNGLSLQDPKWDCNWYVGFGYISDPNTHMHLEGLLEDAAPNKNLYDQVKALESYPEVLKDEKNLWKFCELFQSWLTLKEAYEFYNRGGSHYSSSGYEFKSYPIAERILRDLFTVVNGICDLFGLKKLEYTDKIRRDLYNNMYPTTFTKNPDFDYSKKGSKEWVLAYVNKFDDPKNHKDKIIPKEVVTAWEKLVKLNIEEINHVKFQNLFKTVKN